jgi:hypothetical protein
MVLLRPLGAYTFIEHERNEEIQELDVANIIDIIRDYIYKWYIHIYRMDSNRTLLKLQNYKHADRKKISNASRNAGDTSLKKYMNN